MNIDYLNNRKNELKLTNAKLAELSGVPMSTLSKIMAGIIVNPKLNTLQAIAKALECTIDDFYEFDDKKSGIDNKELILSEFEKQVILKYRKNPQMQEAVCKLLGIDTEDSENDK